MLGSSVLSQEHEKIFFNVKYFNVLCTDNLLTFKNRDTQPYMASIGLTIQNTPLGYMWPTGHQFAISKKAPCKVFFYFTFVLSPYNTKVK